MILKKITLCGFKSFADKTEVVFNRGIAMIVGPNGCGKSNILDAIRWVLGEQSHKVLRSGKMEDVIFNGCESRKPSGMAEVSLCFDNHDGAMRIDFSEVTLTRRLFRSGESQYLINRTPCRLKDIQELFMDTGVGTSSYSIIEQGQMDQIINARPVDRRVIFEEAAGITKFKARRREAHRKLEYTDSNLVRLRDILLELDRQIQTLSRQAQKARRYQALTGELRFLDCQVTLKNSIELQRRVEESGEDLVRTENSITTFRSNLHAAENRHQHEQDRWSGLDEQVKTLRTRKLEMDHEIGRISQSSRFKEERIHEIRRRIDEESAGRVTEQTRLQEFQELHQKWERSRSELEVDLRGKVEGLQDCERRIGECGRELERHRSEHAASGARLEEIALARQVAQTRLVENQTLEQNLVELLDKHSAEIDDLKLSLSFEEGQVERLQGIQRGLESEKEILTRERETKETAVKTVRDHLLAIEVTLSEARDQVARRKTRKGALEDLKQSYEGFFSGVRAVMRQNQENPGMFPGVLGVVSDVIKVQSGYETATEVALGARIQNILIEQGHQAKQVIEYLKHHHLGRVTFIPLDLMRAQNRPRLSDDPRILGGLLEFITFEERFRNALEVLLGRYAVVKSFDDGLCLMREGLRGVNLVTLEGELISSNGMITGGDLKTVVKGILSRENEIDELGRQLEGLEGRLREHENDLTALKQEYQALDTSLSTIRDQGQSLGHRIQETEKDLHKTTVQRDALSRRLNLIFSELEKTAERKSSLINSREEIESSLGQAQSESEDLRAGLKQLEESMETLAESLTAFKERAAREKAEADAISEKMQAASQRILELDRDIQDRVSLLENFETHQRERESSIRNLQDEILGDQESASTLGREREQLDGSVIELEGELFQLKESMERFEGERKNIQHQLDTLQEHHAEVRVSLAELEGRRLSLEEHVRSRYQLELAEITPAEEALELSWEEIPEKITTLESRIRNLGPVNIESIEELERHQERHRFLDGQEKDLTRARDQLIQVIDKINITASRQFDETFEKIKVYFHELYAELFEGGKAELTLLPGEDPLDAGIDIIARPPGKRPQTISLLSGGEKALTAVALLFALFKVKPSPFCIVDELDAPLDDNNITRFTRVLKQFSGETQFIVITHNKNTIRISDLLYGVTQEVRGISRIISIKFVDEELDHLLLEKPMEQASRHKGITLREDDALVEFSLPEIPSIRLNTEAIGERDVGRQPVQPGADSERLRVPNLLPEPPSGDVPERGGTTPAIWGDDSGHEAS